MISQARVDQQLRQAGMNNRFWGRPEARELCAILTEEELIRHAVNGQYDGGFAMLVATDKRLLLVDKKPFFLTLEDVRYDMVSEVDYFGRLLDAAISIMTINKKLVFRSIRTKDMREITQFVQSKILELRDGTVTSPPSKHDGFDTLLAGYEAKLSTVPMNVRSHVPVEKLLGGLILALHRRNESLRAIRMYPSFTFRRASTSQLR